MSKRKSVIPEFGPLAGVRVISAGSIIAMPHAANMLADFGAEVIHIERPGAGNTYRVLGPFAEYERKKVSTSLVQDGRNRLSLSAVGGHDATQTPLGAWPTYLTFSECFIF